MNIIDLIVLIGLLASLPVGIRIFGGKNMTWEGTRKMVSRYRYHIYLLIVVYLLKKFIFLVEIPFENYASFNLTPAIYGLEGNTVFWIQHALESTAMTWFLSIVYIGGFLFIICFSLVLFAYHDKYVIASKLALLNLVLIIMIIPFYLFVIVYTPSYPKMFNPESYALVREMEPLLYNLGPHVNEFFLGYETFNNCFPSMHIGYPSAILMLLVWRCKGHNGYKVFLSVMLSLIGLAILYLGIHWITDIIGGLVTAFFSVIITDRYASRFWKHLNRMARAWQQKVQNSRQ